MSTIFSSFSAPAKLNLILNVVGRRADGYHLLETVLRLIDFSDTVQLVLRDDGVIERTTELEGVSAEQDLAVRAARLLQQTSNTDAGVTIRLVKRIPMGAGLGGGSSDAATVLMALNQLWGTGLSREALMKLGLSLGTDIPFFIFGRNAFATGVGEELVEVEVPQAWYLVCHPGVSVPTADIYSSVLLTHVSKPSKMRGLEPHRRNDLQPIVCSLYPAVATLVNELQQYGMPLMTGSGACVFLECQSENQAKAIYQIVSKKYQCFVAEGLDSHPFYNNE